MPKNKLLSGRFWMTIFFSLTYCAVIIISLIFVAKKLMEPETFLGIFAGFVPVAILIAEWYYKREDRKNVE